LEQCQSDALLGITGTLDSATWYAAQVARGSEQSITFMERQSIPASATPVQAVSGNQQPPAEPVPSLALEIAHWNSGCRFVAGVDEVGRGAWAGPVVAAAVVLPADVSIADALAGVRDSKTLSPAARERLDLVIRSHAIAVAVGLADARDVDSLGLLPATARAMNQALAGLHLTPDHTLVDGLRMKGLTCDHSAIIRGDSLCLSIAAASIVAKVLRDRLMCALETTYPGYGFAQHKGYGTAEHRAALCRLGPCDQHRLSYAPLSAMLPFPQS
jgi:ribonuclease HII